MTPKDLEDVINQHGKWLQDHERAMAQHARWLREHEEAMGDLRERDKAADERGKALDARIEKLVSAMGEWMRRTGPDVKGSE